MPDNIDMHPLDGSFLKLRRADEHLQVINDLMQGFLKRKPYRIITDFVGQGQTRECLLRFEQLEDLPSDLPLLIGDACNNLRSALDHLLWQLWLLKEPAFDRAVYFPICDSEATFKRDSPRNIKDLSDVQRAAIESLQPYKTGNAALSFLRDVNNSDKHRLIQIIFLVGNIRKVTITTDSTRALVQVPMPKDIVFNKVHHTKVVHGAILARIPLNRFSRGTNVNVKSTATVEFAFEDSKTANGQLVDMAINAMLSEVSRAIVLFEPEFAKFGTSKFE